MQRITAAFVLALLLFSACGKSAPQPAASPSDAPAVDISTLADYLRYPGATALERVELNTEDSKGTNWLLATSDPPDKVTEWYRAAVEKNGWVKDPEGGKVGMLEYAAPDRSETFKLLVYAKDGRTNISFTCGVKPKP